MHFWQEFFSLQWVCQAIASSNKGKFAFCSSGHINSCSQDQLCICTIMRVKAPVSFSVPQPEFESGVSPTVQGEWASNIFCFVCLQIETCYLSLSAASASASASLSVWGIPGTSKPWTTCSLVSKSKQTKYFFKRNFCYLYTLTKLCILSVAHNSLLCVAVGWTYEKA